MKKTFLLIVSIVSLLVACSTEDYMSMEQTDNATDPISRSMTLYEDAVNTSSALTKFIDKYIEADENHHFVITIEKDAAIETGITPEQYADVCNSVKEANECLDRFLAEIAQDSTKRVVEIIEMKPSVAYDKIMPIEPLLKTDSETGGMPYGTIQTYNNLPASQSMFAPTGMTKIKCNCFCMALAGVHVLQTDFFGGIQYAQGIGSSCSVDVLISASNTWGKLTYTTSSSDGGRCVYNGM